MPRRDIFVALILLVSRWFSVNKNDFKYLEAVRRLIYITNAIEGFNRQLRKVTKSKNVFPSDDSLLKILHLATMDITKKMDRSPAGLGTDPFPAGNLF